MNNITPLLGQTEHAMLGKILRFCAVNVWLPALGQLLSHRMSCPGVHLRPYALDSLVLTPYICDGIRLLSKICSHVKAPMHVRLPQQI